MCNLEQLLDCLAVGLLDLLRVEVEPFPRGEDLAGLFDELHPGVLGVDVVRQVLVGVLALDQPVEHLSHQLKIRFSEVFN